MHQTPEFLLRQERLRALLPRHGADAFLITSPVGLYYLSGSVFDGYIFLPRLGEPLFLARRPVALADRGMVLFDSPKQLPELLRHPLPGTLALEDRELSAFEWHTLEKMLPGVQLVPGSALLSGSRMVKTPYEVEQIRQNARIHDELQAILPTLYRKGMTDHELSYEFERASRAKRHLGILRTNGMRMESYFICVLAGDNADAPSPYDYSMCGGGFHPAAPFGACDKPLTPGMTITVDHGAVFNGYTTDMTRSYAVEYIPEKAAETYKVALEIMRTLQRMGTPGTPCCELYQKALDIVGHYGLSDYFMGHRQKAKFVGHGVGLELNEAPVLQARDKTSLCEGMVIAIEPKFFLPGIGPVGLENTHVVTSGGMEPLTKASEELIVLS